MSGKEKNDLAQLVSTMVSYSITYRNVKCDSLSGCPRHGAVSDNSSLTFDPPINEFINFEVCIFSIIFELCFLLLCQLFDVFYYK